MLDNCEHLIEACAKIADAILRRCPRVHLVATSREPLGIDGETIYRVPSLSLPASGGSEAPECSDAVALFLERARSQGVELTVNEQTVPVIVSVCQRLDGMPLAIELAAARLRSLSLAGLHERLDQRFRLLTGGAVAPWRGSRRCGRPSTGPIRCSTARSSRCCGACRCSRRGSTSRRPKRSAASVTSPCSTSPNCLVRW